MDQRRETQLEMMIKTRDVFKNYPPDLRTSVGVQSWSGTGDVQYALSGPDLDKLSQYSQQLLAKLKAMPNVVDADTSLVYGKPELRVEIDRQRAADLGVRVSDIATALNTMIAGQVVSTFPSGGEQYDVRLRAEQYFRTSTIALNQLTVASNKVGPVSLDQVVRIKPGTAPSSIDRSNRQRQVTHFGQPSARRIASGRAGQAGPILHRICTWIPAIARWRVGQSKELAPHRVLLHRGRVADVHLHVHGAGGAVRILPASLHDSADAAALGALRHPVAADCRADRQYFLRPRIAAAVRHRQEERDSANRSHQQPARRAAWKCTPPSFRRIATGCARF